MPNTDPKIETAAELIELIPKEWLTARVGISNSIGVFEAIRRVSLHVNADGRRVILFHDEQLDT